MFWRSGDFGEKYFVGDMSNLPPMRNRKAHIAYRCLWIEVFILKEMKYRVKVEIMVPKQLTPGL